MFGLFKKENKDENKFPIPVDEEQRKWLELAFNCMYYEFGNEEFHKRQTLTPESFSKFKFNGDKKEVEQLARHIATIMEINPDEIQLEYFTGGMNQFRSDESVDNPAGQYFEKGENGKYLIALSEQLLKYPQDLISTIAHEFGHVKLLGEKRLDFNDEHLTDAIPLAFGLGIFSANSCFTFSATSYSYGGYLTQMDWGYLLALYAYVREEDNPEWLKYLNVTLQKDFTRSINFMLNNQDIIFKHLDDLPPEN